MRLVNELDAIKNKTHKTGGKKMKKKKGEPICCAPYLMIFVPL